MVDAHFSSMKNLPDLFTPGIIDFQHQAAIGIDSPGNPADMGSIVLDLYFLSIEQIQLTPFTFEGLKSSGLECHYAVQKVLQ